MAEGALALTDAGWCSVTGLLPGTTYYYRVVALNEDGTWECVLGPREWRGTGCGGAWWIPIRSTDRVWNYTTPVLSESHPDPTPNWSTERTTLWIGGWLTCCWRSESAWSAPTQSILKSECEQQYKFLQQEVLGFLISSNWVLGEARALGVKVSDAEVQKQFNQIKAQQFPTEAAFQKFLSSSGETVSDLLLRVKLDMLSLKIQQKVLEA